ncbi:MAG: hypothetical protein ACXU86_22590 [Archangium sp.]
MPTLDDTEKDTELHTERRSAAPGTQDLANAGERDPGEVERAPRPAWTSAAPGSQGEANTQARRDRRRW